MSFRKPNNVFSTILSDVTQATTTLPGVGVVVTDNNIPAGAVVMVDAGMRQTTLATLATGDIYKIVQGKGANQPLMKSPTIVKGSETITIQKHLPRVQQITVIGYNGTTGSLPSANDTSYYVKIRKNDNDAANRSQPFSLFGQYKTSAAADQEELASGLSVNLVRNFANEPANKYLTVDVLMDEAGTEALGAADTIVATAGSTSIVITETGGVLPYLFVVGDFIRLGTAVTDPVYKITATTVTVAAGGTLTVDRPVTTSFAPTAGTGTTVYVPNATAIAAEFGIRLTGVQAGFDVNAFRDYYTNRFTASFSDTATLITSAQGARNGSGVWQQVAMDEYMSYGYEGQNEMLSVPPKLRDQVVKVPGLGGQTALTSKYSTVNIKWTEGISTLVTSHGAEGNVVIQLNLEDNGAGSGILDTGTANTGETLAAALGLTPGDLDE